MPKYRVAGSVPHTRQLALAFLLSSYSANGRKKASFTHSFVGFLILIHLVNYFNKVEVNINIPTAPISQ